MAVGGRPASAHATFPGASSYPSDTDQQLIMRVPHERGDEIHTVAVDVFVPEGWRALACEPAGPWQCTVTGSGADAQVKWTRPAGAARGPGDETFVFAVHTGPPGTVTFPVIQTYSSGEVVRWIEGPGQRNPAPRLTATAAGAPTTTSTASAVTTTHPPVPTAPPTTTATTAPDDQAAGENNGGGSPVLPIAAVAALAALAGGMVFVRRRRN